MTNLPTTFIQNNQNNAEKNTDCEPPGGCQPDGSG